MDTRPHVFKVQYTLTHRPKLVSGRNRITTALDLFEVPTLAAGGPKNWARLFEAAGVKAPIGPGAVLNRASMLIDAATDGQGIALARTALAVWNLINGRLVRPIETSLKMANTDWIVCPKAAAGVPKDFRAWLLADAAEDTQAQIAKIVRSRCEEHACKCRTWTGSPI